MATGLLDFWNNWSIQILVLLSLALQLVLFLFAGIRRHTSSIIVWLAYLLADSTAIYAVGLLSISSKVRGHPLLAFWSTFLMLHLGGSDNITAYALQDNQLWPRHFQTVVVRVLGAAYVLYKNISGSGNLLMLAAALMFSVGAVKYGERTWALKCSNIVSIRSSVKKQPRTAHNHHHPQDKPQDNEEEFLVRRAHLLFHVCKRAMVDSSVDEYTYSSGDTIRRLLEDLSLRQVWMLMELELSLMYDILYTKAVVVHTWLGYCIRVVSPIATVASLLFFQFSGKDRHKRADVAITYVLLAGALFMETVSLLKALGSPWTYAFLCTTRWSWFRYKTLCNERWDRLRRAVVSLQQRVKMIKGGGSSYRSRWWSNTLGQYNMLHFCTRRDRLYRPLLGRLVKMVRLGDWWDRWHYSGACSEIPDIVKQRVFKHMRRLYRKGRRDVLHVMRSKWGKEALERHGAYRELREFLGVEFQEGVIIWHIATDIFLAMSEQAKAERDSARVGAIKTLSNYMMFLLVERPYMLPGLRQSRLYQRSCHSLEDAYNSTPLPRNWNLNAALEGLLRVRDDPNPTSWATSKEKLARILYDLDGTFYVSAPYISSVTLLARKLVHMEMEEHRAGDTLELVLDVWIDILTYAGNKCSTESHAKKLSSGGEFITILWLMAEHLFQAFLEELPF